MDGVETRQAAADDGDVELARREMGSIGHERLNRILQCELKCSR
jgi:hypothetical protein